MTESPEFKKWHRIEISRRLGDQLEIEQKVRDSMRKENLIIEGKNEKGDWVRIDVD